ncbi:peptidoglycan-binding domain-containing protein [Aquimarina sp. 2304DJ70-9]|uniref:peptidoglycan-binding domain-containing protein n=1 Tax=Aquimarina penaris TaxID=3231044 RepID=UPI0034624433
MKATKNSRKSRTKRRTSEKHLFFNKGEEGGFFSQFQESESPFFSTYDVSMVDNPLVGLKRGDGLVFGTWGLRPRVQLLQQRLNEKSGSYLAIDGMFGAKTGKALTYFKSMLGVIDTGYSDISTLETQSLEGTGATYPGFGGELEVVDPYTADALQNNAKKKCDPDKKMPFFLGNGGGIQHNSKTKSKFCVVTHRKAIVKGTFDRGVNNDTKASLYLTWEIDGKLESVMAEPIKLSKNGVTNINVPFTFSNLPRKLNLARLHFIYTRDSEGNQHNNLHGNGTIFNKP